MTGVVFSRQERLISVLYDRQGLTKIPAGGTVAAGSRAIRQGDLIARNTGTKKFLVCKFTEVAVALGNDDDVTVDDAHPFEVGDTIHIDGDSGGRIRAINYETNVITMTNNLTSSVNDTVEARFNNQDDPIGVALLPMFDEQAHYGGGETDVTPKMMDELYGDIALTGRFKWDQLRNMRDGNKADTALAGRYIDDFASGKGVYVITVPAANLEN